MMLLRTRININEYVTGLIPTYSLVEIAPTFVANLERSTYYLWDRETAKQVFGKPDGIFKTDVDFAVYGFTAIHNSKIQRFMLFSPSVKSGKGSFIEIISEETPESVSSVRIAECLARNHPSKKAASFNQELVWIDGELV